MNEALKTILSSANRAPSSIVIAKIFRKTYASQKIPGVHLMAAMPVFYFFADKHKGVLKWRTKKRSGES
jgi:hypothetical protein